MYASSRSTGPAVAGGVFLATAGGYVPVCLLMKYVTAQKNMDCWFEMIAGMRVLAPFRIVIPTPIGTGLIEATKFVSAQKTAKTN